MEPKPAQRDWSIVLRLQVWSHVYRLYIHMQISVLRVERRPIIANKVSALAVKFCHRFHINMHLLRSTCKHGDVSQAAPSITCSLQQMSRTEEKTVFNVEPCFGRQYRNQSDRLDHPSQIQPWHAWRDSLMVPEVTGRTVTRDWVSGNDDRGLKERVKVIRLVSFKAVSFGN